ncbi:MAG: hypothetical protein WC378_05705 [Opitutaceae bacterium]|jgi:hypothetical protein
MKFVRFLVIGASVLAALFLIALGVSYTSGFQTWAVRKALASRPELKATVGRVSVSLGSIALQDVRADLDGIRLAIPSLEAELSLYDAVFKKVQVKSIVAKGWTVDLTRYDIAPSPAKATAGTVLPRGDFSLISTSRAGEASPAAQTAFTGIFKISQLPVELSIAAADLAGELVVPSHKGQPPTRISINITGGHLKAGQEGKFDVLIGTAMAADAPIQTLRLGGAVFLTMDTSHSFTRMSTRLEAEARGTQAPQGARLTLSARADRSASGEIYSLQVDSPDKTLVNLQAELPEGLGQVSGSWTLNASDTDLAPFALGRPIPIFRANGKGRFSSDVAGDDQRLDGQFVISAENLEAFRKELGAMGAVRFSTNFDLTRRGDAIRATLLQAEISGMRPVVSISALQGFEFDTRTRELKVADTGKDLMKIDIFGLPLAWVQPYLKDLALEGSDVTGSFVLRAHAGGFALHATRPIAATGISVTQTGKPLVTGLDLSLTLGADYTPQGWQTEMSGLSFKRNGVTLLNVSARAGQLAGAGKAVLAQGQWKADLPAILSLPAFADFSGKLTKGRAQGEFTANLAAAQSAVQARLELRDLFAPSLRKGMLPEVTADVRADVSSEGTVTVKAPLTIANAEKQRSSDLTLSGTIKPGPKAVVIDVRLSSQLMALEDVQILAAPLAIQEPDAPKPAGKPSLTPRPGEASSDTVADIAPFWSGIEGQVTIASKKVILNDAFFVNDISGSVKISPDSLHVDGFKAGLSAGGSLSCNAALSFLAAKDPYAFKAEMAVVDFDSKGLYGASGGVVSPTVEAKFNMTCRLEAAGRTPADLAENTTGRFDLISKGGTFRLLRTDISDLFQQKSSSLGNLVTAGLSSLLGGKGDSGDGKSSSKLDEYMRMASDIAEYCAGIPFDQMSIVVLRDSQLNLHLRDFSMISPMIRLSGSGDVRHVAGTALANGPLDMRFQMGARGKMADYLGKANLLDKQPDTLGYVGLAKPLHIGGTLANPDTSEFKAILKKVALAKAGEAILDRLLGGR